MKIVSASPGERVRLPVIGSTLPEVSVLVPVTERPEPLDQVYREYSAPFRERGTRVEFLFLVEPWGYALAHPLFDLIEKGEPIRVLEVGQNATESAMLQSGAHHAVAPILLTLPAYHRVEAFALPMLVDAVSDGADVVVARRWPRRDSLFSRVQNRIFHTVVSGLAGNRVSDVACGVRAMRTEVLQQLPLYGDFHRFLPLFAKREGFRVRELAAPQHPKDVRSGLFGPGVYLRRVVDLLGLFFLLRFTDKPLRFFGMVGGVVSLLGILFLVGLFLDRVTGQPIAGRPLLVLSVMLLVIGFQAIALGLIGEIMVHFSAPNRRPYRLAQPVTPPSSTAAVRPSDEGTIALPQKPDPRVLVPTRESAGMR
jgi:hypothetical protein